MIGCLKDRRVTVLSDHFSPDSSGGVERVVHEVYKRLADRGARITVITVLRRGQQPYRDLPATTVHAVPMSDLSRLLRVQVGVSGAAMMHMGRLLDKGRPDVVHTNGLHFQTTLAAAVANRGRRWPMVFSSHVASLEDLPQPVRALTNGYEQTFGRFILSRCSRVIAISESVHDHVRTLGVPDGRIDNVWNGVDHARFHPEPPRTSGAKPPLIMFVGRHMPNKGPQVLVEALVELDRRGVPFRAELLSNGPLRESLESRVSRAGLEDRVNFRGHVADVAVEMRRADIVARPSFCEGMPLSLLEAMATGVAIATTNVTGNRDLIRSGSNGLLVPPGRAPELADALQRLLTDPTLRRRLGAAAVSDAQAYSWDLCADQTEEVLLKAADGPRR